MENNNYKRELLRQVVSGEIDLNQFRVRTLRFIPAREAAGGAWQVDGRTYGSHDAVRRAFKGEHAIIVFIFREDMESDEIM